MKKKLKDFTQEDIDNFCKKYPNCKGCPYDTEETFCVLCFQDLWGDLEIDYESNN